MQEPVVGGSIINGATPSSLMEERREQKIYDWEDLNAYPGLANPSAVKH